MARNAYVTISLALGVLAVVLLSIGAYQFGVAVVDMDPSDASNYDNAQAATDPAERDALKAERGETATIAWALVTGAGVIGLAGLVVGLMAPPRD
ncbi:MAG: hypothetical protein ACPHID_04085 [Thermoplasmatota archaeon]